MKIQSQNIMKTQNWPARKKHKVKDRKMYTRHDKQYDSETNLPPKRVFRQELVTWEDTESGLKRTIFTSYFGQGGQRDVYEAEPIVLKSRK